MLKQEDVEVVIVASPSNRHGPDSKAALKAGKHVVVEKPMAMSLGEADSMIAMARETGRKLFVHQNYRFNKEFLLMKEVIASGKIGRVYAIRNYISHFARRNDWQTLAKNGGGVLNNTCVHFIDQILQLLPGKVTQAMGDLQQIASAGDVEDHVKALLRTDSGATADLAISSAQNVAQTLPKWIVCGTTGTLTGDGKNYTVRWFDAAQVKPLEAVEGPAADRKYGNDDKLPWQEQSGSVEEAKSIGDFYDNVAAVLRNGAEMEVTPESVRETMRVIALIRKGTGFLGKVKTARPVGPPRNVGVEG
jgi:predicted dehydrogenase